MKHFGHISTDGGPVLLATLSDVSLWRGIEGGVEGSDDDRVCQLVDADDTIEGIQIALGAGNAILWDVHGGGTVEVYLPENRHAIMLMRPRVDEEDGISALAAIAFSRDTYIGSITVRQGAVAILDSTENTSLMSGIDSVSGRIKGDFAFTDSTLVLSLNIGTYRCYHERVEAPDGLARRLYLEFSDAADVLP